LSRNLTGFLIDAWTLRGQLFQVNEFRITSVAEQAAEYLRNQILRGHWSDTMPGRHELAEELGINHKTVESALKQLETQGLLAKQGVGRGRRIQRVEGKKNLRSLRIAILTGMPADRTQDFLVDIKQRLIADGHVAFYTKSCQYDLGMDPRRIARLVKHSVADAWVVVAGSREILEWFSSQEVPAFALFGRWKGLPIAGGGPDKAPAYAQATRKLLEHGHRRIVLLTHRLRRLPVPGASESAFLAELKSAGIAPGSYHLPDWEETVDGFQARLESLFRVTPPTALIVDTAPLFAGVEQFIARRGLRAPENISLVCTDESTTFLWQRPPVSHIRWDKRPVVRRVVNWAANIGHGQADLRQTLTRAEFVTGGSIGPAIGLETRNPG
jgi:DNA-binding LacI/PurR family transcriptional regulator/DNA-binding transcriptional regulator YhcF (GntR family)